MVDFGSRFAVTASGGSRAGLRIYVCNTKWEQGAKCDQVRVGSRMEVCSTRQMLRI